MCAVIFIFTKTATMDEQQILAAFQQIYNQITQLYAN